MDKLTLDKSKTWPQKHQLQQQSSVTDDKLIKINDRIEAFDAKHISEKGTVKLTGRNKKTLLSKRNTVGTHTVSVIYPIASRFKYPKHHN